MTRGVKVFAETGTPRHFGFRGNDADPVCADSGPLVGGAGSDAARGL